MPGHLYASFTRHTEKFDAMVIGSGMGGLSAASLLSKAGKKVLLLERHYIIGGYTHYFQRKGYTWDVGLHYVGQVHIKGTLLNRVFRYISNEKLEWTPLDDVYDRAVFGNTVYEFPRGRENLIAKLKEYFPAEQDKTSIDAYFRLLNEVKNVGVGYYIEKALPPFMSRLFGSFLRRKILRYSDQTTLSVFQKLTNNEKLIGVLTAQYGDYGLQPAESSFYMHAVLANHYMDGAGYPVGGAGMIAETVVPVIEAGGGAVLYKAEVKQIIVENNTAVGVEMADGKRIYADTIVSDAGVVNTFSRLLPEDVVTKYQLKEKLQQLTPSLAHMGLYIGMQGTPQSLQLPRCNFWIFPEEYNHEVSQKNYTGLQAQIPVAYASFPAAKDPEWSKKHPGKSTAEVIILVPYTWFKEWEHTAWKKRDAAYEDMKKKVADQMFAMLYQAMPQLKGKIDYYEISTPLTTKNFTNHPSGEIYGAAHTPKRFRQRFLKPYTPVKNLFLTGQDVLIASIAGGMMGGVLCASAILKKNLLWTIYRKIK